VIFVAIATRLKAFQDYFAAGAFTLQRVPAPDTIGTISTGKRLQAIAIDM